MANSRELKPSEGKSLGSSNLPSVPRLKHGKRQKLEIRSEIVPRPRITLASSTGRRNTTQIVESTMLPTREPTCRPQRIGDSQKWPEISEGERLDFVSNVWVRKNWSANDTEILEVIIQDGIDRLKQARTYLALSEAIPNGCAR
jgi:hypothetical protein